MRIRTQLVVVIVPLLISGVVGYLYSTSAVTELARTGSRSLEEKSYATLDSLREAKTTHVEDYFAVIRDQMLTFAGNGMIVARVPRIVPRVSGSGQARRC